MKRYGIMLTVIFVASCGMYSPLNSMDRNNLSITTDGPDAIVEAIKSGSNITSADANRWSFSWVPYVGENIRERMIIKVKDFLRVCLNTVFANRQFDNSYELQDFYPDYKPQQLCDALSNLMEQARSAGVLLERFGTDEDKQNYRQYRLIFAKNIAHNKDLMKPVCRYKAQQKMSKKDSIQQNINNQLAGNVAWWKLQQLRWQMAKDMGTQVFNGVKWVAQTANENSAPLLSAAAMWFVYDKIFGTSRWTPSWWNLWGTTKRN